jgi:hypothetical protein
MRLAQGIDYKTPTGRFVKLLDILCMREYVQVDTAIR